MYKNYLIYQVESPDMMGNIAIRGISHDGEQVEVTLTVEQMTREMVAIEVFDVNAMFGCGLIVEKNDGKAIQYAFLPQYARYAKDVSMRDGNIYYQTPNKGMKLLKFFTI